MLNLRIMAYRWKVKSWVRMRLSEGGQMKKVRNQECHHLKKYDKLVNRTKKRSILTDTENKPVITGGEREGGGTM